ncbi:hypothetical protein PsorP6_001444 [Peronosclerospora sorghi]|uniref:Uncharacterized protein n=1 Tax=Peronosclerospora sorghi TaxID=230839 RepID=A0ACC0WQJ4_9STRA|nr:hypothetical protein PsorP6_001444 [Peronosclerospora sorghi]
MEIAVASNSALGQYLAEIDAEVQQPRGDVTTTLLKTRTKCDGAGDSVSEGSNWLQLFKMLRRRMETIALHRLISELSALHPTFRLVDDAKS